MNKGSLSQYFKGVAAKRLTANEFGMHEFYGRKELRQLIGDDEFRNTPARYIWLGNDNDALSEMSFVSWYDSRKEDPKRSAEYKLYYFDNPVMERAGDGDLLIVIRRSDNCEQRIQLMLIVAEAGSAAEDHLTWLFGLQEQELSKGYQLNIFKGQNDHKVGFSAKYVLDELGIEIEEPEADRLDSLLISKGYVDTFPQTRNFSALARETTIEDIDPRNDPDTALMAWMEQEEKLFRRLERNIVSRQLEDKFSGVKEIDVDLFVSYSLSVHNRRKSRAGYALENHLGAIFRACNIRYDNQAVTENKKKPDFLFPGAAEYHDPDYPEASLTMLGVKSTCKDRWRQVLSEAKRVKNKHLLTLEPGISQNQTDEMAASHLQLVLPKPLHATYSQTQQQWLMDLKNFIEMVKERQGTTAPLRHGQNELF
jgi:hypothetical protein